jgi:hypothetical protein
MIFVLVVIIEYNNLKFIQKIQTTVWQISNKFYIIKYNNINNYDNSYKMFKHIKSKIIPYCFTLFSIVFLGYILIKVLEHYITKYIL